MGHGSFGLNAYDSHGWAKPYKLSIALRATRDA